MYGAKLEVEVGEKVILTSRYTEDVVTVKKITPTGIIKIEERSHTSFDSTGRQRGGDSFSRSWLKKATPEKLETIKYRKIVYDLSKHEWGKESRETLDAINNLINKRV